MMFSLRSFIRLYIGALLLLALPVGAGSGPPVLLVLGDSLSAAYGIERSRGWVELLGARLREARFPHRVINASVSGDTTAGGLARLPDLLAAHSPSVVVVELGGNDGLRAIAPAATRANLEAIVRQAQLAGAGVVVVPVRLPPNYGEAFVNRYLAVFETLAAREDLTVSDYLMRGVAEDLSLMQPDGIHPLAEAQPRLLDNVWPAIRAALPAGP